MTYYRYSEPLRRQKIKINNTAGAQCSPRHACPLHVPLLMQAQQERQHAPALALAGKIGEVKRMQYDALNARNDKK